MKGRVIPLKKAPRNDRLIVCGGHTYGTTMGIYLTPGERKKDELRAELERIILFDVLDELQPREIGHGGAPGADTHAGEWARRNRVRCTPFKADWSTYGKRAGHSRNLVMFELFKPGGTIAFPGNNGTQDMIKISLAGGAYVVQIDPDAMRFGRRKR